MQTQKGRTGSSEAPKKARPQGTRQLKTTGLDSNSSSSSGQVRTPKERSPKIVDRPSPKSSAPEKKRPSRISELESRVSQLAEELKKAKDQLTLSESSKNEALQDAEKSKNDLVAISSKLEEVQNKLVEQSNSQSDNPNLEPVEESVTSANGEVEKLKSELMETRSLVENMKVQLTDSRNSEAEAQALARETLHQLETAKKSVEALRSDGSKSIEAYNSVVAELEQSKARIKELEALVNGANDLYPIARNGAPEEGNQLEAEVERLRSALEVSERKYNEEQTHNALQVRSAYELVEQIKSDSLIREAELEAELKRAKSEVEELKADLMDKETELQGISEENDDLNMKLRKNSSSHGESELEIQLTKMKASLTEKETQLKSITEENEILKSHLRKNETNSETTAELESLRAAEREAAAKLGVLMEEADRSSKRAARLTEQLEASQAANAEMEADLRRMKVQSDQWRKAAEAAAAMITAGNNGKFVESGYEPVAEKMGLPYSEDLESEMMRKRNGNMLKKIGVLWKKA